MKKKSTIEETDLIDITLIVWKKKLVVIIFITFGFFLAYFIETTRLPTTTDAKTAIRYITFFEEAKYKVYNSIIGTIKPFYSIELKYEKQYIGESQFTREYGLNKGYNLADIEVEGLQITNINKDLLLNLFIDTLAEKNHLIEVIKKFNLIKKENFLNKLDFEEAVRNLAYSIKVKSDKKEHFIVIKNLVTQGDDWENFLKLLEKETNIKIQEKLSKIFNNYVGYVEAIKKFQIEDIDTQLTLIDNEVEKAGLEKSKDIIIANKYAERMQYLFDGSPISNPVSFYAAKLDYNLTEFSLNNVNKKSPMVTFIVVGIIGAILGIFFVLIANAIQKRK